MSEAAIIDGTAIAAGLRQRVAAAVVTARQRDRLTPGLATVLIGGDPASEIYIRSKVRACAEVGIASFEHRLPADAGLTAVLDLIHRLNADERIDGVLVQLPLPPSLDRRPVLAALDPAKDVDGFTPVNVGRLWSGDVGLVPCTPQGILLLLRSVRVDLAGAEAVVLGRSQIVGRPIAGLLVGADCTDTIVHSHSHDTAAICRRADIVVAAIGHPAAVAADWISPGAVVVDVGINRVLGPDGRPHLVGDVDFAAARSIAGAITPVPGGVGPMTIACLLRNTVVAAHRRAGLPDPEEL